MHVCTHYAQNLGVSKIIFIKNQIKNQYKNKDIYNVTKYLYISSKCFPLNRLFIKESWKTKGFIVSTKLWHIFIVHQIIKDCWNSALSSH